MKDPVCGMEVDVAKVTQSRDHKGQRFYFCSTQCAKDFDAAPEKFTH